MIARLADLASLTIFLAFLVCVMQPAFLPIPPAFGPATWAVLCYAFAVPVLLIHLVRRRRLALTPFDYLLGVYILSALATWPTGFDRDATGMAIVGLVAQIAVFYATKLMIEDWPFMSRVVVTAFVVGIALLELTAIDYHVRQGLSVRLTEYSSPPGWNGRAGLGFVAAIQFALLVGIWQQARSRALQVASICLLLVGVIELIFLYSRLAWMAASAAFLIGTVVTLRTGRTRRYWAAVGVVVALVATAATRSSFVVHLAKTAVGLEQGTEAEGTPAERFALWHNAVSIIDDHLFMGVGLGNFQAVHAQIYPRPYPWLHPSETRAAHPHNVFLQAVAEVGLVGGLAYIMLWSVALWAGWRISARRTAGLQPAVSAFYGLVAIAVTNMGENMFLDTAARPRARLHTLAWILLALVIAEWNRLRSSGGASHEPVN